jgi:hypothetical protein
MAKKEASPGERANENPAPTLPGYEASHVTASKEKSRRVATVLVQAGIRVNQTVWHEIGHPEYVIEVHRDDLAMASEAFAKDLGPSRTLTSKDSGPSIAPESRQRSVE